MYDAVGRTQTVTCALDPARAIALHHILGCDGPAPEAGTPLPPFFHQVYFWNVQPAAALGRDGHPATGGFIPDLGLPRRMWAGGRLTFEAPLRTGRPAQKTTVIEDVHHKQGRVGPLAFVTLRHEIRQDDTLCVTEWQDLVYLADQGPSPTQTAAPQAPEPATSQSLDQLTSTLLFRYSALTMNGHRIHYDADYARNVERYTGLVVHGPLLAQLLMLKAAEQGPLSSFSFRGTSPLTLGEQAILARDGDRYWIAGADNRLCMRGTTAM
ncbi:MaoC family dehydratase N-terminal domain-containing protein [Actibacterium sp. 188UL27-1]|uniref:FAS1-like dehydratase domain-containing protein n=1 Tax=Actibacterium sp. 188UL27-1 TaxID=2786961 RepID=UPI0019563AB4|nr:MaoC family dehydratase N-terminal domain-containing protein [Actibacterium sp. 188UL27-1]MBM7070391.1 MaoC family dehydratase N-terminal domain-containing protein [Actibacterium sp. 188UL27-1]